MSSVNGSPIAASVSQTALQQSQVARQRDAERNQLQRGRLSDEDKARSLLETVEDSYQATDDPLIVHEDGRNPSKDQPGAGEKDEDPSSHIDIRA